MGQALDFNIGHLIIVNVMDLFIVAQVSLLSNQISLIHGQ